MSLKNWLLSPSAHSVTADTQRWLAIEQDQHAEQTARERLTEWQKRYAIERDKARQLGREYGRASRTIHALRAEHALLREGLRQAGLDLADERSVNDELAQALDQRRPAPHPGWLGADLRRRWFATSDELTDDERWEQVAETAIDAVRGLWPSPSSDYSRGGEVGARVNVANPWPNAAEIRSPENIAAIAVLAERLRESPGTDHPTTAQAGCADAAVAGEPEAGAGELPASGVGPVCAYCGADCSGGRSWDGGGLYACPTCADARARSGLAAPQTSPGGEDTSSPQPGPSPSGDTPSDDFFAKAERYGDEIGRQLIRAATIGSATGLLRAHARDIDSGKGRVACFCGWGATPPYRTMTDHAEHQAEQLAAVGLLAIDKAGE